MKKVFDLVKEYALSTFNWKLYSSIFLLIVLLIGVNYSSLFVVTYEKDIIRPYHGEWLEILLLFITMYLPYLIACAFITLFSAKKDIFKQIEFWWVSTFLFFLIACYRGAWFESYSEVFRSESWVKYVYYFKLYDNIENLILVFAPLTLFYFIWDRRRIGHFYGIRLKEVNIKPYVIMLLIIAGPIFVASLTDDFQKAYPKLRASGYLGYAPYSEYSNVQLALLFECVYLLGFIIVELVFRGALIYSLEKYLGKYVVLPMVVVYAVLHFGKPLGETIGSIFGGYILGVLALRTKNIYGGIFIHMGVAFLMELFAFISIGNGWSLGF